jgi:hypothetical protein
MAFACIGVAGLSPRPRGRYLFRNGSPDAPGVALSSGIYVQDVLAWDPQPEFADVVVSSFGLKTFDHEQQRRLARLVARLLKPGGTCSFIEVSVPPFPPLRALYMFYLKWVIPLVGRILLGKPDTYRMLGVFTQAFRNANHFADCLREAGLAVSPPLLRLRNGG